MVDVEVKYDKFKCPKMPDRSVATILSGEQAHRNQKMNEYESISSSKWYKSSEKSLRIAWKII